MELTNTTQTNYLIDSTQLAKFETQKDKLLARFKAGLITEQYLAYCMHMLSKQEDSYSDSGDQDTNETETQKIMWHLAKRQEPIMYSRAKSRSYGLTRMREVRKKAQRSNYYLNNIEE